MVAVGGTWYHWYMEERPFEDHDHESRRKDHCSKRRMILDPG